MLYSTRCIDCDLIEVDVRATGEIQPELIAVCICPEGHVTIAGLTHDLFDILYSSAIRAFRDSYYSESVMSFSASLERCCEQYVKLFSLQKGLSLEQTDAYWKELSSSSERQLGAFCLAYAVTERKEWKPDRKQVEFRNKVVHKGHIAVKNSAEEYAKYVTSRLNVIMKSMKSNFSEVKSSLYFHNCNARKPAYDEAKLKHPSAKCCASGHTSLLKWNYGEHEDATLEDAIVTSKKFYP